MTAQRVHKVGKQTNISSSTNSLLEQFETAASNGGININHFTFTHDNHPERTFYYAAVPGYARFFFRDAAYTALMTKDLKIAENSLHIAAMYQGKKLNPITGERKGLPPHEFDPDTQNGIDMNGKNTLYNASDNAALFLILHEDLYNLTGDYSFITHHRKQIQNAVCFIKSQLNKEFLFIEDPKFCQADRFALSVTYWKDSKLPQRKEGKPLYPVIYPLLHFQNLAGIRSAAQILNSSYLKKLADKMLKAGLSLFDEKRGNFPLAIDTEGEIDGISSDGLHLLFFLEPNDLPWEMVEKIVDSSRILETEIGYRALDPKTATKVNDPYHSQTVWNHEQAVIQIGALKFYKAAIKEGKFKLAKKLGQVIKVTKRGDKLINKSKRYKEIFYVNDQGEHDPLKGNGNNHQLWVWGAMEAKRKLKRKLPKTAEISFAMATRQISSVRNHQFLLSPWEYFKRRFSTRKFLTNFVKSHQSPTA